jgi:hypothetical protein
VPFALAYTLLQVSDFDAAELARIDLAGITSHDAAVERIQRHSMGWSWTHQRAFAELGVACRTLIPASEVVRRLASSAGADEMGSPPSQRPEIDYLQRGIGEAKPQVLFFDNPAFLDAGELALIRALPAAPLLITHFCAALRPEAEANLRHYDLVLCCSPRFEELARAQGATTQLLYHAAPPAALELPLPPFEGRLRRTCFIGSIVPGSHYHSRRLQLLRRVCRAGVPIDIYSDPPASSLLGVLRRRRGPGSRLVRSLEDLDRLMAAGSPLHRALRPPVYGPAMFHTMQRHLCAVNVHAGMAQGYAANMRLFEAAALGVCLISEDHPNLPDLFEPGREILTYGSAAELIDRIRFCVDNPREACAIGERARQRALASHRYADRVVALHGRLLQLLDQRR